jgi:NAD(P)H-hydrate epimerase
MAVNITGGRATKFTPHPGGFPERRLSEVPVVSPAVMREIQKLAQEEYFFDILQITENAGLAAARLALAMLGGRGRGQRVVVLAGGGNMGGTGLCAARHLVNWGVLVEPVFAEVEAEFSFNTRRQSQILKAAGMIDAGSEATSEAMMEQHLHNADLIIDAIAGYGLQGAPTGVGAALVRLVHTAGRPVLALDVPTGVSASTGESFSPAIVATTTLAMDLPKQGVVAAAARAATGELYLTDLGIPRIVYELVGVSLGTTFIDGPLVRLRR